MKRPGGFDGPSHQHEVPTEKSRQKTVKRVRRSAVSPGSAPDAPSTGAPSLGALPPDVQSSSESQPSGEAQQEQLERAASSGVSDAMALTMDAERAPESYGLEAAQTDGVRRAREELKRAERSRRSRERREQRRFTSHIRARRRRWFIASAAIVALALFVLAGVYTPIMAVREVQIEGAQTVSIEELQQALSRFEGVPLALVDDNEVHRALEPFPLIQRYAIERIPPHTLIVRIDERSPVIALEREGGYDLLDAAGVLLSRVPERPLGVPLGSAELADTASAPFRSASAIVRDMPQDLRERLVAVSASNAQNVTFTLDSGTELIWGDATNTQRKAAVLRALLQAIGAPSMIDVSAPEAPVYS